MPRGMSKCRICGKQIPSIYRPYHENTACLRMRAKRGDWDVITRNVLPRVPYDPEPVEHPNQKRLFEVAPPC